MSPCQHLYWTKSRSFWVSFSYLLQSLGYASFSNLSLTVCVFLSALMTWLYLSQASSTFFLQPPRQIYRYSSRCHDFVAFTQNAKYFYLNCFGIYPELLFFWRDQLTRIPEFMLLPERDHHPEKAGCHKHVLVYTRWTELT